MAENIELYVRCPSCEMVQEVDTEKDIALADPNCEICGFDAEITLSTLCKACSSIIQGVIYDSCL